MRAAMGLQAPVGKNNVKETRVAARGLPTLMAGTSPIGGWRASSGTASQCHLIFCRLLWEQQANRLLFKDGSKGSWGPLGKTPS